MAWNVYLRARCVRHGKKLKIHRALPMRRFIGEPATVIANGSRGIQVGCGKGSLLLIQVQLERKRAMPERPSLCGDFRCRPEPDSLERRLCRKKTASSERAISIRFSKSVLSWKRRKETNLLGPLTQGGLSL